MSDDTDSFHQQSSVPAMEQIENNPKLLAKMVSGYQELAADPDAEEVIRYVMKMGVASFEHGIPKS